MKNLLVSSTLLLLIACTFSAPTPPSTNIDNTMKISSEVLTTMTLEKSPTRESSTESTTTALLYEMVKMKLPMTSSSASTVLDESLIGSVIEKPEATVQNNKMIKIHESETSQVPSTTITSHSTAKVTVERKSINSMSTPMAFKSVETKDEAEGDVEIPINADNLKIMEEDVRAPHKSVAAKKGKEKESKKKAQQSDKKQKLKQKLFMESTIATIPLQTALTVDEMHDTTTVISTSIKTAPTTIKSTTLTITSTTESMQEETTNAPNNSNNDNVIVLNSSGSGLIVVDVMENFGKENSTSVTSNSFEIKMDLIDDVASSSPSTKDDIFTTTIEAPSSNGLIIETTEKSSSLTTQSDDIILINEAAAAASTTSSLSPSSHSTIRWNELGQTDDIKITFDNIDLPHQNVNVSIENGELIIDSIDISVLNRVEEELRKKANETKHGKTMGNNSLEIVLVEDDNSRPNAFRNEETTIASKASLSNEDSTTTIHFEMSQQKMEQEMGGDGDDIKIKTTDKDSDTVFYISNTEVKVIESIPTLSPSDASDMTQVRKPAIYEEDVIVDVPKEKSDETPLSPMISRDKYEEDIVLSPLTSDFDPKDINYIGEAFLDVEESANSVGLSESHHIIPLTSDVVIQPIELKDLPNVPIIGEPPQIELEEMMFGEDYDSKQQHASFQMEEFSVFPLNNRLVKNELLADVPREAILDTSNSTILSAIAVAPNKTHISVNTIINGTNMTTMASPAENITVVINPEAEEMADSSGENPSTFYYDCKLFNSS